MCIYAHKWFIDMVPLSQFMSLRNKEISETTIRRYVAKIFSKPTSKLLKSICDPSST